MIDINVNLQDFRHHPYEGFEKGTEAAVAGGITTLIDRSIMRSKKRLLTSMDELERTVNEI
jgi:dihydroorotase-like cyclic amidohydrolase